MSFVPKIINDASLSEKRAEAGRLGAQKRWGKAPEGMKRDHLRTARPVGSLVQGRNDWYTIRNKTASEAEVFIYDEIGYFGVTAKDFIDDLNEIEASTIKLHLNTPGGDVFDGIAIFNALLNHQANVEVHVDSLAASAGSFIAMAGDERVIAKNGSMMIHDAHGLAIGNSQDMKSLAELLDKQSDNIASIYADHAGGSVTDWRNLMKEETWFSAEESVEHGLMDKVAGKTSTENSWDLSIFNYTGRDKAPKPPTPTSSPNNIDLDQISQSLKEAFND